MGNPQENHREVIKVLLLSLRYSGLWSFQDNSTVIMKITYGVYSTIMTSLMWILVGTLLADLFSNSDDLVIITDDGCYLAGLSVIVFKLLMFRIHREEIRKLMKKIYDPIDTLAKCSDEGVMILVRVTTFWDQLQAYSLNTMGLFLVVAGIALVPTDDGALPIRAKYPFDTTIEPMHTLAIVIQAGAVATGLLGIFCMDGLVISFLRFITLQLEILASNYRHCSMKFPRSGLTFSSKRTENSATTIESFVPFIPREAESENDSFVERFTICIKHHERLINIVDSINTIFGSSMLSQLVASTSMICLTGFQAALGAGGGNDLIKFALYCGSSFSQLFLWCFMGNLMLHEGLTIANSQWQSGWENENYSEADHLIIMSMMRSRKTFELKAINFFSISMETYIMILRASYSFFTLLKSFIFKVLSYLQPFLETQATNNHQKAHRTVQYLDLAACLKLFASSSMIVSTGFQAALGTNSRANLMKFGFYCGTAFSQLLSWCSTSNLLLHQGFALADSQWLSGWENENLMEFRRLIVVSIIRGKRKFELRAIDFYPMTMETFIMILRALYSFFTSLTVVTNGKTDV